MSRNLFVRFLQVCPQVGPQLPPQICRLCALPRASFKTSVNAGEAPRPLTSALASSHQVCLQGCLQLPPQICRLCALPRASFIKTSVAVREARRQARRSLKRKSSWTICEVYIARVVECSRVAQRSAVVRIPGFAFHAASAEVRQSSGEGTRSNSLTGNAAKGSWKAVYMNRRFSELLPELQASLELAACEADAANWGVLEALELEGTPMAMRCAEYHTVLETCGLPIQNHYGRGLPLDARPDALRRGRL